MSGTKRIVIIGAGPGGLASAMLLAGAGYDVTVLERQATCWRTNYDDRRQWLSF